MPTQQSTINCVFVAKRFRKPMLARTQNNPNCIKWNEVMLSVYVQFIVRTSKHGAWNKQQTSAPAKQSPDHLDGLIYHQNCCKNNYPSIEQLLLSYMRRLKRCESDRDYLLRKCSSWSASSRMVHYVSGDKNICDLKVH